MDIYECGPYILVNFDDQITIDENLIFKYLENIGWSRVKW